MTEKDVCVRLRRDELLFLVKFFTDEWPGPHEELYPTPELPDGLVDAFAAGAAAVGLVNAVREFTGGGGTYTEWIDPDAEETS